MHVIRSDNSDNCLIPLGIQAKSFVDFGLNQIQRFQRPEQGFASGLAYLTDADNGGQEDSVAEVALFGLFAQLDQPMDTIESGDEFGHRLIVGQSGQTHAALLLDPLDGQHLTLVLKVEHRSGLEGTQHEHQSIASNHFFGVFAANVCQNCDQLIFDEYIGAELLVLLHDRQQ